MIKRLRLILILLPLALDCFLLCLCGGSFGSTLSSEAWKRRDDKRWSLDYRFIDKLLARWDGANHCERAADREETYGSVWAGWMADFKGQE